MLSRSAILNPGQQGAVGEAGGYGGYAAFAPASPAKTFVVKPANMIVAAHRRL